MLPVGLLPRPVSPHFGLKKSAGFYPNKPNAFVMGSSEKAAAALARLGHVKIDLDDTAFLDQESNHIETSRQRLDRYFKSGDGLILTPNHSTYLDALVVGLMSKQTGHRPARMAAKELFEKNRLIGRFLQANNTFSVDRGADASKSLEQSEKIVASGESLLMFPQGHINWKHHLAELEEFKLGAANIAIGAAQRLRADGTTPKVKLVPLTFLFEPKGERREIEAAMDKGIRVLEKKRQKRLSLGAPSSGNIQARLDALFRQMVEEREKRYTHLYEKRYKALNGDQHFLKASGLDYYARLEYLQKQILELLEREYLGQAERVGSFERRARKLKGVISAQQRDKLKQLKGRNGALKAWSQQASRDKKTLQDIIIGLSLYKKDYLNHDIGRQIEFMARLSHDVKGQLYSVRKILKFLRKADVEVKVVVGKAVDVSRAINENPQTVAFDNARKDLALSLTSQVQRQIQNTMDKAVAAKPPKFMGRFMLP